MQSSRAGNTGSRLTGRCVQKYLRAGPSHTCSGSILALALVSGNTARLEDFPHQSLTLCLSFTPTGDPFKALCLLFQIPPKYFWMHHSVVLVGVTLALLVL